MRSIRRSLLGYLLVLLAVALGAVGVLVDRFANGAIRTREASETDRIEHAFNVRQREAKTKFDADVMSETKALAKDVHYKIADLLATRKSDGVLLMYAGKPDGSLGGGVVWGSGWGSFSPQCGSELPPSPTTPS